LLCHSPIYIHIQLAILIDPQTDKTRGGAKDKNSLGFECDSFGFFLALFYFLFYLYGEEPSSKEGRFAWSFTVSNK
jgi:hypothetical protein